MNDMRERLRAAHREVTAMRSESAWANRGETSMVTSVQTSPGLRKRMPFLNSLARSTARIGIVPMIVPSISMPFSWGVSEVTSISSVLSGV